MIKSTFNLTKNYQAIIYARMSSDSQNPDSPEQQIQEIKDRLHREKLAWTINKVYIDRGISGRYVNKRPGYQTMLRDIRSGRIKADLILVDTPERLGRNLSMASVRQELQDRFGVLILSADNNFADPTSSMGRINAVFQEIRGTEDNRVKSHQVMRGKKDTVRKGYWPGGPPPFGFRLERVAQIERSGEYGAQTKLVPDEQKAHAIRLLFQRAHETNHGSGKLAKYLNEHFDIAQDLKPFFSSTIDYWLKNRLYIGEFVFNKFSIDIVNDVRVRDRNDDEDHLFVEEFCEPIVTKNVFEEVQALKLCRKRRTIEPHENNNEKLIKPLLPSNSVKYCLAGLVRCHQCGASMVPTSHAEQKGDRRAYYRCPRRSDGTCENSRHVPAAWLETTVINEILQSLLGDAPTDKFSSSGTLMSQSSETSTLKLTPTLEFLIAAVQRELEQLQQPAESPLPALRQQIVSLDENIAGWILSMGSTGLTADVRSLFENKLIEATARKQILKHRIRDLECFVTQSAAACDRDTIMGRIERLADVLLKSSPSRLNLELSLHIDSIVCGINGNVVLRICQLGVFPEAVALLPFAERTSNELVTTESSYRIKPRRRTTLRLEGENENELADIAAFAADPHRFAAIDEKWFIEKIFSIPKTVGWAESNANAVATKRMEGLTESALAKHFEVSIPTIRKARKFAAVPDDDLKMQPRKMPRSRWHEENADEAFKLKESGKSLESLAVHFGKCEETVRKAVALGRVRASQGSQADT
jgi:DNA invertase Pin-like site-specific DNA recombinase